MPMHPTAVLLRHFLLLLLSLLPVSANSPPPNDAVSLLAFKSHADLHNTLPFTSRLHYCQWLGVHCNLRRRVSHLSIVDHPLGGTFSGGTLTNLRQLRVLILRNDSLSGALPDLSPLSNLLFLDLAFNNFSGNIPAGIFQLTRLYYLNLQFNHFNGSLPPLSRESNLRFFNVTGNYISGRIPESYSLSKFPSSSFSLNPNLCGEIVAKHCAHASDSDSDSSPLFDSSSATNHPSLNRKVPAPIISPASRMRHKREVMVLGFSLGALFLTSSLLCVFLVSRKQRGHNVAGDGEFPASEATETEVVKDRMDVQSKELKEKVEGVWRREISKSEGNNNLVFCMGEGNMYTLDQLMKATAEMLGKGTMGTTYKAQLGNRTIVTVKRLDGRRMMGIKGEMFERHMVAVGALRHQNLVPLRAYFQAKEERLIIYDYQPNGSLHHLIHGSRSTKETPLHWTSCLKIAEEVAQALSYIHQISKLVHGNLKSSNILLGSDFEARVTDYCLATLTAAYPNNEDPDSARYRAPESQKPGHRATSECDVYAFGVLLLELVSGAPPSQHPVLRNPDMLRWVQAMRGHNHDDDDDGRFEDTPLGMLVELASLCSLKAPEQRPKMWQVLKIIQQIKAAVTMDA